MKQSHGPWAYPTRHQKRSRNAMSAIVWFVVIVACLTLANHVWEWI